MKRIALVIGLAIGMVGCTQQEVARKYGGTEVIILDPGRKLVNITWKGDHLWILTRERQPGEPLEEHKFSESSSYGIMQGTVVIKEK